ncbi:hypothetical protein LUZ62_068892 [Rhynchospora pubera]|uniref:DUF7148 domain-containing protein n=1 Tax=Rhynchospora pubera TaxID=906938 RepID=A0AAV8CVI1_9POAL|nr:hypothetical protein LUZ62_068892 [Rhynchospora pubera]
MAALRQLLINSNFHQKSVFSSSSQEFSWDNRAILSISSGNSFKPSKITYCSRNRRNIYLARAEPGKDVIVPVEDDEDGVSLGTLKLPGNTDLDRFETLLFQWANSLCQGANIPLPVPLKVDKIKGGARLGFIKVDEGKTEVLVYIDCIVSPATDGTVPMFRAIRNGPLKADAPPGEPRIMQSLLQALQKSVQIATL